jgi:hypothetical protein
MAINGPAYPAVNKLLKRFGFKRMPDTFAELAEGVQFCNDMEKLCRAGANGVRDEALIAVRMRYLKRGSR